MKTNTFSCELLNIWRISEVIHHCALTTGSKPPEYYLLTVFVAVVCFALVERESYHCAALAVLEPVE